MRTQSIVSIIIVAVMSIISCESNQKTESVNTTQSEEKMTEKKEKTTIICRVLVKEGTEAAFIEAANKLVAETHKEEGCISYCFYQSPSCAQSFIFYEEYKDDAAFKFHANSVHFKAFAEVIPEMLAEELNIEQF